MLLDKGKKHINRVRKLIILCFLTTIVFLISTYAWFVGTKTVDVSSFEVEIATTDSLLLSLDGETWDSTVSISQETLDSSSYEGNTNSWGGKGLFPMSSIGAMDTGASRMKLFEKASLSTTPGGFRLMASRVHNYEQSNPEQDGYVVFDLFIKNFSGTQYIKVLNELDEEPIYLTVDSAVTVAIDGVEDTGIENSVRVAFAQIGRVIGTTTDATTITGISCTPSAESDVTGICRTAQIWEPNDTSHVDDAIRWYNTSCKKRTGSDVTSTDSYSGTCGTVANEASYPTYAVNDDIESSDNIDIYDGTAYNGYTGSTSLLTAYDYLTDTEKLLTGTSRPTFMNLAPNSITKVRIYVYIEGQDIDNYDFSSIGKKISVKFGFTKERYKEEDIKPVLASENCFSFNSTTGTILDYYNNENNISSNSACPKSIIIPSTINETTVTAIADNAFKDKGLKRLVMPDTITTLGNWAFINNQLTSVKLSNTLTSIGNYEFANSLLTKITIPDTVTSIGSGAFQGNQLTSVSIPDSVITIDSYAFENNKLTSVTLSNSATSIGYAAFQGNQLTSVSIPDSVTSIERYAFDHNKLASLTLSNALTSISRSAFSNNLLTSITIPSSITSIGDSAFSNNELISVLIPDTVTSVGTYAFYDNKLISVSIPDSVIDIKDGTFYDNKLTNVTIPNTVTSIGVMAFYNNLLTSITIPSSVTSIKTMAFRSNQLSSVCIKGKSGLADFTTYEENLWGWSSYEYNDSNITWNCTD